MALKYGNTTVQNYIFDCGKKYTVSNYKLNNNHIWSSGGGYDENATPAEYFTFTLLGDGTYSIKAKNPTNMPENIVFPSKYGGKAVTVIEENAFLTSEGLPAGIIQSVYIPKSITTIDFQAFVFEKNLKKVIFEEGSSLITIGMNAFMLCGNLIECLIPDSVTSIGQNAFSGCTSLTGVVITDSVEFIDYYAFGGCDNLTIYCEATSQPEGWDSDWNPKNRPVVWGYKLTDESLFTFTEQTDGTYSIKAADVSNLPSEVGIPFSYNGKAVTAIDENAFYSATINKVVIPEGVTRIGNGAFDNCKRLLNVSLPNTLTEIGGWAFRDCTALTSIVIPIGVTTIGTWAFLRDMSLTINCEAASQPSGWHTDWNLSGGTVVWGYTG